MPRLTDPTMEQVNTSSNYGFSAVKIDALGATEYTLVTVVVDTSSSLWGYDRDLEAMIKASVESCKKSPRSENLLVRLVSFNQDEKEEHGFKLLKTIQLSDYDNTIQTNGSTALFDATFHAIEATADYGKILEKQDFFTNAIVFVITDGDDNNSTFGPNQIKQQLDDVRRSEDLESIAVVLVGMSGESYVQKYLDDFKNDADLDLYIDMGEVTPTKLAKLAGYLSKSISSTSQALGSGGPSKSLSF